MNIETHMKREYNKKEIMKIFNIPKDERIIRVTAFNYDSETRLEIVTVKK